MSAIDPGTATDDRAAGLLHRFREIREATLRLCEPLSAEDQQVQSMVDASPTKWHLAHTTWFFETFVLEGTPGYRPFHPQFRILYNSYYQQVGDMHPRPQRGLITRPSLAEIHAYRQHVESQLADRLQKNPGAFGDRVDVIEVGLNHEQQHQELMLMDIKHVLSCNPLFPSYRGERPAAQSESSALEWLGFEGGIREIGHRAGGFAFDNEGPRHEVMLRDFELASRPVTNQQLLEFVEDDGYQTPDHWLSDAWTHIQEVERWRAPMYWTRRDGEWMQFTLHGLEPLRRNEPATHLSYYEADALARWAGARLPTEAEWETVAAGRPIEGNFMEDEQWHPRAAPRPRDGGPAQLFGDVWEWTQSAYCAYPGFRIPEGAIGEYNGKFMANQFVLRGGCWATPRSHIRPTYRNFFHPWTRWHFGGLRLARDV